LKGPALLPAAAVDDPDPKVMVIKASDMMIAVADA
jgi:hypothetical protein